MTNGRRRIPKRRSAVLAAALAAATLAAVALAAAAPAATLAAAEDAAADTSRATVAAPSRSGWLHGGLRFGRADVALAIGGAVAIGVTAHNDRAITRQVLASDSRAARRLARVAEPLGNSAVIAPAVALAWGAGRALHAAGFEAAVGRVGISLGVAAVAALGLKTAVGRSRPRETPNDARDFDPFSNHDSFPSGHAALAFAAASALNRETRSVWVPALAYPVASLVGWSRVHDREHWASDVLGGALLGSWTAAKTEDVLAARAVVGSRTSLRLCPVPDGARVSLRVRF